MYVEDFPVTFQIIQKIPGHKVIVGYCITDKVDIVSSEHAISNMLHGIGISITFIHNWSLQLFSWNCDLASHTIYVVCVNFLNFLHDVLHSIKSIPNDRFLRSFSWQFYLLSEFLQEIC